MKSLSYLISIIFIGTLTISGSYGQTDYSARLHKELVKIEAGNYISNDYQYVTFSDGNSMQIAITATCPTDVMNRDNFISIYSTIATTMLLSALTENGAEMPDIKELDELIGEPDITFNLVMAKNGLQIQVITSEDKENFTRRWSDLFEE